MAAGMEECYNGSTKNGKRREYMLLKYPETRFEEIYEIYEEAFPPVERRKKEDQKAVLENPCYYVRIKEDERMQYLLDLCKII